MRRVAIALAVLAGLAACSRVSHKGVTADRSLTRYLPADVPMLAGVDMAGVTHSALYQRHAQDFNLQQLDALQGDLGIDPRTDISQALITWDGTTPILLAQGHFDNLKRRDAVVMPQPDILLIGPNSYTAQVSSMHGEIPGALQQQMEQLPHGDQLWIVSDRGLPLDRMPAAADVRSALSNISDEIRSFRIGLGFDQGAHLRGDLICDSDAGAKRVHDGLRGMIGLGRLMTPNDQLDRLKLYDALHVDQDHAIVHVQADLDASEADAALAMLRRSRAF